MNSERVVIVTGANSGIGLEACKLLCRDGYQVIMACRNEQYAMEAASKLRKLCPEANLTNLKLDLGDLSSVVKFVEAFHQLDKPLHVLVNNAGIFYQDNVRKLSADGLENTMATNHIGSFLLTHLLLGDLKSAAITGDARIIFVTSMLHNIQDAKKMPGGKHLCNMDFEDFYLEKEGAYSAMQAYKNSKFANVAFAQTLARRLEGSGVSVNSMCPGFIPRTGLVRHASGCVRCILTCCLDGCLRPCVKITRRPEDGGMDIYNLATAADMKGVTGKYYSSGREVLPSEEVQNIEVQKAVCDISQRIPHFPTMPDV